MSLPALLEAVYNQLTKGVPGAEETSPRFPTAECDVCEDGQPHPDFGKRFFAIHAAKWQAGQANMVYGMEENYQINVTITCRINALIIDKRKGLLWLQRQKSLDALCRQVMRAIHQNHAVIEEANRLLLPDDNPDDVIINHLEWLGTDPTPTPRDGAWVNSDNLEQMALTAAYSQTVYFGKCQRIQHLNTLR